jgi:hypothetical protein
MTDQSRWRREAEEELRRATRGDIQPLASIIPRERETLDDEAAKALRTMVFISKHGGEPHVVTRLEIDAVVCTCPAMRSIEVRPAGCWAMKAFRAITGMEQP